MAETRPATLTDFLTQRLRTLPRAARLVIVLDPVGRLGLDAELSLDRRVWRVVRYDGNDLTFRRQMPRQLDQPVLIWVTRSAWPAASSEIDLSSLTDVLCKADEVLDLSLVGVLSALIPNETWPSDSVDRHADILADRLDVLVDAHAALRPHLSHRAVLDIYSVRALALNCLQPSIAPQDFLFKHDTPARVLSQYIHLAWALEWDDAGRDLLRQQAREASRLPLGAFAPWFVVPPEGLAQFAFWYRFLSRVRVPNLANQLRGLGLLDFDPEALEPGAGAVLALWEREAAWRNRVIRQAEASLQLADIRRAVGLLNLTTVTEIAEAIGKAEAPALIYYLGGRLLEIAQQAQQMAAAMQAWSQNRPAILSHLKDDDAAFARAALAIASILDEAAVISKSLARELTLPPDLAGMLDWYIESGFYDLEFAHARATIALQRLPDEDLRRFVQAYLDFLRRRLRDYLDRADHELASRITSNWTGYLGHARLATRVLWDFVRSARLKPTKEACLWFIVFDGMRYDTWERVVKPRLMRTFMIKKEKAYLSILPSWTRIARTSLMAGRAPDAWRGTRRTFTFDQASLAANLFDLTEAEQERKLRFYSGMESDRKARKFDRQERYPYNLLVFNISDDNLHKQRGHIGALNQEVQTALDLSLEFLDGLIRPEDTVIVSSDHGFTELDPEDALLVKDDARWERFAQGGEHPVSYRHIMGIDRPAGLPDEHVYSFEYREIRDGKGKFTVPIGKRWFQREGAPQAARYAHGGLSLAEMVVPGAVLQLITEKKIDIVFDDLPAQWVVDEDQPQRVGITLHNKGNQPGEFELTYSADTDAVAQVISRALAPDERFEVPIVVTPVVQAGRVTQALRLMLKFTTAAGKPKTVKREVPVQVRERKDKVEISFGGLDDLDR